MVNILEENGNKNLFNFHVKQMLDKLGVILREEFQFH